MKAAVTLDWLLAGLMALLLPLAPLLASAIAQDASYLRGYRRTLRKAWGHLHGLVQSQAFSRYVLRGRSAADARREPVVGQCTHCGNCCLHRRCIFLDWHEGGVSRCRIYHRRFWKMLACGRYPESRLQIALYACPSFRAAPVAREQPAVELLRTG